MVDKYNAWDITAETVYGVLEDLGQKMIDVGDSIEKRADKLYEKLSGLKEDPTFKQVYASIRENAGKGKEAVASGLEALADKYNAAQDSRVQEKPKLTGIVDGFYEAFTAKAQKRSRKREYMEGVGVGKALGVGASAYMFVSGNLLAKVVGAVPVAVRAGPKVGNYLRRKVAEAKEALKTDKTE